MRKHSRRLKALIITTTACLTISSGRAEPEYTGILGYQTITLGPGYNFVGINFKNTNQAETFDIQTLLDTSKLHGAMVQGGADQMYLWDADKQEYIELWMFDSDGSVPDYDNKWIDVATGDVAAQQIGLGHGFWYIRNPDEFAEVVVTGAVEEDLSFVHTAVPPPENRDHSYNLFVSAYPVDKVVNEMDWSGFTGGMVQGGADQMYLWQADKQEYAELWLFDSDGSVPNYDGKWIDLDTGDVAGGDITIAAGTAVWILKQTGDDIEEHKPF